MVSASSTPGTGSAGGPRIALAAALLAASVLLSRALGFVREMVLAYRVGVGPETDAYSAAFQIPDLLNYMLAGGAFTIAFIPIYTRARTERGVAAADHLYATVLGSVTVVAALASALLWWQAEALTAFLFRDFDPEQQELTSRLTRIVLPAQVCFAAGGIVRAALMAQGRFGAQAAAPLVYNLGIIAGGLFLAPYLGVAGFAWGALGGALLGPLGLSLLEARGRVPLRMRFAPFDRDFLAYLVVALPLMLGVTLLTVDEWYDRLFGQSLGVGAIAVLRYSRQLMLVPVAVVGQTLATAALPTLSRLWNEDRLGDLASLVQRTLQGGIGFGVLSAAGVFAVAQPLVTVVYRRGAFLAADVDPVADALRIFCLAVPGWIAQQIAVRPFYARGDTWRPMLLGTAVALASIPLYLALGPRFGVSGLAAAGAIGVTCNALATLLLARRMHEAPALRPLLGSAWRALLLALPGVLAALWLPLAGDGMFAAFRELVARGATFCVLASAGIWFFGDEALRATVQRLVGGLWRRLSGRGGPPA